MRAVRTVAALSLLGAGFGCAPEAGVQAGAGGAYVLSARGPSGHAGVLLAQSAALQDARAYCSGQGRRFLSLGDEVSDPAFASGVTYTVRFRCPAPGDPELPRPTVQTPDDIF